MVKVYGIKRPVVEYNGKTTIGFDLKIYEGEFLQ